MCAIESAPPHCTILNCCAGLFYGAFLYNAASVESFDCGEMHFHFDLSFTQTFFISCQELVVANTQVESMLLNDTISVFSERITSCSSAWANEFLVKYSYLKAKDKLVLLIKFAALQACISILKYTTREHIYIDLEGWNDDVLEHLSSSTIWRDQSESQHFEVALFNYRLAFADEMASNIYVENGCEKNYFCCHQRDEGATLKESAHLDQYNTSSNWLADHYCDLIVDRDMKEIPKRPIRFINLDDNEDASVYLSLQVYSDLFC